MVKSLPCLPHRSPGHEEIPLLALVENDQRHSEVTWITGDVLWGSVGLVPGSFAMSAPKIVTRYEYPPIPIRSFDWSARYDGDEPNDNGWMPLGWGYTEAGAIEDLRENHPRGEELLS
jgi:hypothetical protein